MIPLNNFELARSLSLQFGGDLDQLKPAGQALKDGPVTDSERRAELGRNERWHGTRLVINWLVIWDR